MTFDFRADAARVAALALAEDGPRDITSDVTVAPDAAAVGVLEFRSVGVFAGRLYADAAARLSGCDIDWRAADGDVVGPGAAVGAVRGALASILRAERTVLNLLQRASGIATTTRAFVEAVRDTGARILHTRKTAPGLRGLDVTGVLAGGGCIHRLDLSHTVMVKDNHWHALMAQRKRLSEALNEARVLGVTSLQVEVESEEQLRTACAARASRLLIDNQSPETVRRWAALARAQAPGIEIEATGGITLETVRAYAAAGADFISVGALTHSVRAADIALEIEDNH